MSSDPPEKSKRDDLTNPSKDKAQADNKDAVRPVKEKIPESDDNLRRRADWFQKRSGEKQ